jgi:capsular polysaccharide biosynthesis protein
MANISFLSIIKKNFGTLVLVGLFVAALGFVALIVTSPRYEVRTDFLVNQNSADSKDYYTLARSSDYIGKVLGEVIYSEKFINAAVETGKVNQASLPFDKSKRIEAWSNMVKVRREADLGILHVTVLSDDSKEAQMVSEAVAQVLRERNKEFLGTTDAGVAVSILSGPITDKNPNLTEILTVLLAGFLFGFILATFVLYVRKERHWKKALVFTA